MQSRISCAASLVALALAPAACGGDDPSSTTTGSGGNGGTGGSADGGAAGQGGGSGGCSPQPGVTPGPDWVCVTDATGTIIDEAGAPVADLLMSACGPGGCEPDVTDAAGSFAIEVGFELFPDDYSLIPHGRELGIFTYYFPLDEAATGPVIDLGALRVLTVPATGAPLVVKTDLMGAPAQTVTHGEVTIDVPAGVRVNLDFEDVSLGAPGKDFRALKVPTALIAEYFNASPEAAALYAFTPFDARFDLESAPGTAAKVSLSFVNTTGIAAGTPVEFVQLGSFIVGSIEAGDYQVVATGAVSSDGTTIAMDPGEGVEFLSWIAIRPLP